LRGFEGAAELVRRCADNGPVVVVSGALRDEILLGLRELGVEDRVLGIVSAEDARLSKPHPQGYLMGVALLESRLGPSAAWRGVAIEDSLAGVRAAKAAQLACVAVTHSYGAAELTEAGADLVVPDLASLTDERLRGLHHRLHG
jgi:beta-phosphoglucomutase-like phosphatase (HAD superfamily)